MFSIFGKMISNKKWQHNENAIKLFSIIGVVFGTFCFIAGITDLYTAIKEPHEYISLYGMNETGLHWRFRSFTNLIITDSIESIVYLVYILLNFLCFRKQTKRNVAALVIADIIILALVIRFYYLLQQSGYDHYPGFDPYFF